MKATSTLDITSKSDKKYRVLDLFAGCGGFSHGFLNGNFDIAVANEFWEPAQLTYEKNHPDTQLIRGDVTKKETRASIYEAVGDTGVSVIIGGPPCQAYSNAGYRDPTDPRGKLFEKYVEIVSHLRPLVFVMENVTGLLSMKHIPPNLPKETLTKLKEAANRIRKFKELDKSRRQSTLATEDEKFYQNLANRRKIDGKFIKSKQIPVTGLIMNEFAKIGYKSKYKVLNAADYGAPQARQRVIVIGTVCDAQIVFPEPNYAEKGKMTSSGRKLKKYVGVKEAIDDLKNLPEDAVANHNYTKHKPGFVKRLEKIEVGKGVYKNYSDAWWRCYPDKPSRTVKENHGGVFVHYEKPRVMTPRELARLQTFPDSFIFESTKSMVLKQIGNAVPPVLGEAIAGAVKLILENCKKNINSFSGSGTC